MTASEPTILEESDSLLILNKPSGLASAALPSGQGRASVVDWLRASGRGEGIPENGLIHRLDTDTSGVLAIAKSVAEHTRLRSAWSTPAVEKRYRALVSPRALEAGKPKPKAVLELSPALPLPHRIDYPIGHDAKSAKKMRAIVEAFHARRVRGRPQPATSWIESLRICEPRLNPTAPLLELGVRIETGVQHQIRVHLATIGYPILGDALYHGAEWPRLALHAERLTLPAPDGKPLTFIAPLPDDWSGSGA